MRLATISILLFSTHVFSQDTQGLHFIQNKGQWNDNIDFQALVPGGRVGVSPNGFSVLLLDMAKMDEQHLATHGPISEATGQSMTESIDGHYFQIQFHGANKSARPIVENPLEGYYNYFLGDDTCRWAKNALAYSTILYRDIYKGIDLRVASAGSNLKYDFIVHPGADPSQISINYEGVYGVDNLDGDLQIKTVLGTIAEVKPYSYQVNNGVQQPVASAYRLKNNTVTFSFPENYDKCSSLVIDPLLIFSTYSGSTADNWGSTATPGEHGTLYSAGVTRQNLGGFFPATPGAFQTSNKGNFDMAIIKYDSAGERFLYATHLGGVNNDSPESLVVDKATGDLIVLGLSSSPDYPTSLNAYDNTFNLGTNVFNRVLNTTDQWDIVLTRLVSSGDGLVGSTFLGGSGNDGINLPKQSGGPLVVNYGDEMRGDVITDEDGHVYISSVTSSADFPIIGGFGNTFNGATDAVVVKLEPDLSGIIWSTYLGGTGHDAAYSIKFDNNQDVMVAGGTTSSDFPVTAGAYQDSFNGIVDGWIARIAADGSAVLHATFTGTPSFDQVYFIDLNSGGSVFCYGQTTGQMPVSADVYNNPNSGQFLQKFSSDLSTLEFSTVFGSGSTTGVIIPNISPTAFLVNDCDNIYMSGWGGFVNSSPETGFWQSSTHGMPITQDAYQTSTSGSDFYFMVLNGSATQLVYSTFLGGNSSKTHVDGGTSRFDKFGIVYHAVCSGCAFGNTTGTQSSDFPTTSNAHSRFNRSQNCNNAAFKFDLSSLSALFETNNTSFTMPGFNYVCYPDTIVFQNISTGGINIEWDFGDGRITRQTNKDPRILYHQYQRPGSYPVKLKITDLSTCSQTDSITKIIYYYKENIFVGGDGFVCEGESYQLTAAGGVTYSWTSKDGTFTSSEASPFVQPATNPAVYYVTVTDVNGCTKKDTVNLVVTQNIMAKFQTYNTDFSIADYNNVCFPDSIRFKNLSTNGIIYKWDFGDGTIETLSNTDTVSLFHSYEQPGNYKVTLTAINLISCNTTDIATKMIHYFKDQIVVGDDGEICEGTSYQLSASGGANYEWYTENHSFTSSQQNPQVSPVNSTNYYVTVTDANNCVRKDTVEVRVVNRAAMEWEHQLVANCMDRPAIYVENRSPDTDDVTYQFDFGDGTTSSERGVEHSYDNDGNYTVRFTSQREFCEFEESVEIPVYKILIPNVITPESSPGLNDYFIIGFGDNHIAPQDAGLKVHLLVFNRWGSKVFEADDYRNDWGAQWLAAGVYYVQLTVGDLTTCKTWLQIMK